MLLAYIPDLIESRRDISYAYQLYEIMVDAWLEREKSWVNKSTLRDFSERVALDIYLNREARGMERVPYGDLANLAAEWGINLQHWQITGRSLLNRDAEGNYKFVIGRSWNTYLFCA
jgi:hypothetical protein